MDAPGETGAAAIRVPPRAASGRAAMRGGIQILRLNRAQVEATAAVATATAARGRPPLARRGRTWPLMSPLRLVRPATGRDHGQRRR